MKLKEMKFNFRHCRSLTSKIINIIKHEIVAVCDVNMMIFDNQHVYLVETIFHAYLMIFIFPDIFKLCINLWKRFRRKDINKKSIKSYNCSSARDNNKKKQQIISLCRLSSLFLFFPRCMKKSIK
jgi:hypothetical protein